MIQLFSSDPELLELIRPIQLSPVTANTLLKVFIKVVQDPQSMVRAKLLKQLHVGLFSNPFPLMLQI